MRRYPLTLFALVVLVFTAVRPALAHDRYEITDLGVLPGKTTTSGYNIHTLNNHGQVVGFCSNGAVSDFYAESVPFLWSEQDGIQSLPGLPGAPNTIAWAINDRGQIIGEAGSNFFDTRAVLWDNGVLYDLGVFPGDTLSEPRDINNRGQVVGYSLDFGDSPHAHPVLWENGQISLLPGWESGGVAGAINEKGEIAGALFYQDPIDLFHAYAALWHGGSVTVLGGLGGVWSHAWAMNNTGMVGGQGETANGEVHAFVWKKGVMTDLGTLGGTYSAVWDINNKGQIVGSATNATGESRAVLWEKHRMIDLNARIPSGSGWVLLETNGINERGQIGGYGLHNGEKRFFLLTPRP